MAQIVWTDEAERWLRDIYTYIAKDDKSAAIRVIDGIYAKAQLLVDFPQAGYRYDEVEAEVRILLYGHYRITYSLDDNVIVIIGVFHGALEIEKYLV